MTIETELLKTARAAGAKLAESERLALLARADYHTAIRRLHLAGGSLREIAQALELSHQRVQQIVNDAGGSWWQRIWRTRNVKRDAVCTFCGDPPGEVAKLIAGPNVYICDACVTAAERTLDEKRRGAGPFTLGKPQAKTRCAFCAKKQALAVAAEGSVCGDCLRLCREILEQRGGRS
jgi:hypothetical protein